MENDSIRSSGGNTLVDIWIDGKLRAISVSHEAIGAYLGFDKASRMSEEDRAEFTRTNLPMLLAAAKTRLRETDPTADSITIDVDHFPRPDGRSGDRRLSDRRKGDRRKVSRPRGDLDRRRGDRRTGERRQSTKRTPA